MTIILGAPSQSPRKRTARHRTEVDTDEDEDEDEDNNNVVDDGYGPPAGEEYPDVDLQDGE